MLTLGIPTLIECPSLEDCAKLCTSLGLQFIELNMCLPQYQPDRMDIPHMRDIADKYGIFYTIHLDDTNTPCDFNPRIARAYTETVLDTIGIAKQLSIPILNMHLSLGTGELPIAEYLSFANQHDCRVVLEVKTADGLAQSLQYLQKIL